MIYLNKRIDIDMPLLNSSLLTQVVFQSFPLLVIQFLNNSLLGTWYTFSIVSIVFSLLNISIVMYRLLSDVYINSKI